MSIQRSVAGCAGIFFSRQTTLANHHRILLTNAPTSLASPCFVGICNASPNTNVLPHYQRQRRNYNTYKSSFHRRSSSSTSPLNNSIMSDNNNNNNDEEPLGCDNTHLRSKLDMDRDAAAFVAAAFRGGDDDNVERGMMTEYEKLVRRLYKTNLFHPVKMGLDNIHQLHRALGSPMDRPNMKVIHIAGTNGKGSVALKIAKAFELSNYRTGLFVSPHISSFRERIQVNSNIISEEEVAQKLPIIYKLCEEQNIPATFFELTAALAFAFFADCDVVVLETGLGGRLDATNVVESPELCVITSIGLEHTRILGDTIELIAGEKAGIIKKNRPVLVGPNVPHNVIRSVADKMQSDYYVTDTRTANENCGGFVDYDIENSRIAETALRMVSSSSNDALALSEDAIQEGISIRPPCRFEETVVDDTVHVILDVAHNPPALQYLLAKLRADYPSQKNIRFVLGFSSDKDLANCTRQILNEKPSGIHLVQASHSRAASIDDILEVAPELKTFAHYDIPRRHENDGYVENGNITTQVEAALALAKENNELLVVCGSAFIMSEVREALGYDEPRDTQLISQVLGRQFKHGQEHFGNDADSSCSNSSEENETKI